MAYSEESSQVRQRRLSWKVWVMLSVAMLVISIVAMAIPPIQRANERRRALDLWLFDLDSIGGHHSPFDVWLDVVCGDQASRTITLIAANSMAEITDEKLAALACFADLTVLDLNGDVAITEGGLKYLKCFPKLERLHLGDARLSVEAVQKLKQAMPRCEILWDPPVLSPDEAIEENLGSGDTGPHSQTRHAEPGVGADSR